MSRIKNEQTWSEIEESAPFADGTGSNHTQAWEWLEKLQEGNLRQIDIMRLGAVLRHVYELGRQAGAAEGEV